MNKSSAKIKYLYRHRRKIFIGENKSYHRAKNEEKNKNRHVKQTKKWKMKSMKSEEEEEICHHKNMKKWRK